VLGGQPETGLAPWLPTASVSSGVGSSRWRRRAGEMGRRHRWARRPQALGDIRADERETRLPNRCATLLPSLVDRLSTQTTSSPPGKQGRRTGASRETPPRLSPRPFSSTARSQDCHALVPKPARRSTRGSRRFGRRRWRGAPWRCLLWSKSNHRNLPPIRGEHITEAPSQAAYGVGGNLDALERTSERRVVRGHRGAGLDKNAWRLERGRAAQIVRACLERHSPQGDGARP